MSEITKPIFLDETGQAIAELIEAQNHLLSHQNAAIDLIASDKRAELVTDISTIATLCKNGEILEVMDYGDKITPEWVKGTTHYNPPMNLCHESDELLEDGESIHGAFFEWHYTTPDGIVFDAPEAIFASENALSAGDYYFKIAGDSYGGNTGKYVSFTLASELTAGKQIRKKSGAYNANITDCTLGIYANGADLTGEELAFTVSNVQPSAGINLGDTDGTGDLNHWNRVVLGNNRWKYSNMRQYLNATGVAGAWWVQQHKWDVKPSQADSLDGFLHGYDESVIQYFKPIKVVTVAPNVDDNVEDVTYDRVFLSSLEQMYCVPQFSGKEGAYWEYYKRLLGRTTPAPTSATYARLIKYALNATTSAQFCWRRSASRYSSLSVWDVFTSGYVSYDYAYYAFRCAPGVFISD